MTNPIFPIDGGNAYTQEQHGPFRADEGSETYERLDNYTRARPPQLNGDNFTPDQLESDRDIGNQYPSTASEASKGDSIAARRKKLEHIMEPLNPPRPRQRGLTEGDLTRWDESFSNQAFGFNPMERWVIDSSGYQPVRDPRGPSISTKASRGTHTRATDMATEGSFVVLPHPELINRTADYICAAGYQFEDVPLNLSELETTLTIDIV